MDYRAEIEKYINNEVKLLENADAASIEKIIRVLLEAYEREGTIYVFGNGGSAATASHMANDFNKGISEYTEKKFRVCCLNDNMATVLAIANDIGYGDIFSFQLKNKVRSGDVVIGISGSGNSQNVINALRYAKEKGAFTVGLVGFDGGEVYKIVDAAFYVPIRNMQIVEDMHMILNHMMMYVIMQGWKIQAYE